MIGCRCSRDGFIWIKLVEIFKHFLNVRKSEPRVRSDIDVLPLSIKESYIKFTPCSDIMYVNGIQFFITISRHIQFGSVARIKDAAKETLIDCIQQVQKCYSKRGFTIQTINMDS